MVLLIALPVLQVLTLPTAAEPLSDEARSKLFIHPLLLEGLFEYSEGSSVDRKAVESVPVRTPARGEAEDRVAPFFWADRPSTGSYWEGYIGYREAARWTDPETDLELAVLEIGVNTGGTGVFGSLVLLEKAYEDIYIKRWSIGAGDRCNDGGPRLLEFSASEVIYAVSATPFRLLNPTAETNWRVTGLSASLLAPEGGRDDLPPTLFGWRPYSDVANSASSCTGEIVLRRDLRTGKDEVLGVTVNRERFLTQTQGDQQSCVNDWLRELELDFDAGDKDWIPLKEWAAGFPALGERCAP